MVHERHPTVAATMVQGMARDPSPCFEAARTCVAHLTEAGFEVPPWTVLKDSTTVARADSPEPGEPKLGGSTKPHCVCISNSTTPSMSNLSEL